jgi:hypothetical protein
MLANGLLGLLVLMAILLSGLQNAIKTKNQILVVLLLISFVGFIFESMLETQAGIVFFVFFYLLFNLQINISKSIQANNF